MSCKAAPVSVRGCQVMWYDDGGGVQVPNGLRIEYWNGSQFVPVKQRGSYNYFPKNAYGIYSFSSVKTTRLRMTVDNTETKTAVGIVEWKLLS